MPFRSEKQRRYLYANQPKLARQWSRKYGDKIEAAVGPKKRRRSKKKTKN